MVFKGKRAVLYAAAAPDSKSDAQNAFPTASQPGKLRNGPPGGNPRKAAENQVFSYAVWAKRDPGNRRDVRLGGALYESAAWPVPLRTGCTAEKIALRTNV